jgi:RNA polymerase sigma-54 factor
MPRTRQWPATIARPRGRSPAAGSLGVGRRRKRDWYERIGPADSDDEPLAEQVAEGETLQDHLLWQLHLSHLSPRDRTIGVAIIESIDDDGYLRETIEAIAEGLQPAMHPGLDEVLTVLHQVQRFDPPGVGARSLNECLHLQLDDAAG